MRLQLCAIALLLSWSLAAVLNEEYIAARDANQTDATNGTQPRSYIWDNVNVQPGNQHDSWRGAWLWNDNCNKYLIKYCFEDQNTLNAAWAPFIGALARWAPAMGQNSDVWFAPDPLCADVRCVCHR